MHQARQRQLFSGNLLGMFDNFVVAVPYSLSKDLDFEVELFRENVSLTFGDWGREKLTSIILKIEQLVHIGKAFVSRLLVYCDFFTF